jgi:hypothetical protein
MIHIEGWPLPGSFGGTLWAASGGGFRNP